MNGSEGVPIDEKELTGNIEIQKTPKEKLKEVLLTITSSRNLGDKALKQDAYSGTGIQMDMRLPDFNQEEYEKLYKGKFDEQLVLEDANNELVVYPKNNGNHILNFRVDGDNLFIKSPLSLNTLEFACHKIGLETKIITDNRGSSLRVENIEDVPYIVLSYLKSMGYSLKAQNGNEAQNKIMDELAKRLSSKKETDISGNYEANATKNDNEAPLSRTELLKKMDVCADLEKRINNDRYFENNKLQNFVDSANDHASRVKKSEYIFFGDGGPLHETNTRKQEIQTIKDLLSKNHLLLLTQTYRMGSSTIALQLSKEYGDGYSIHNEMTVSHSYDSFLANLVPPFYKWGKEFEKFQGGIDRKDTEEQAINKVFEMLSSWNNKIKEEGKRGLIFLSEGPVTGAFEGERGKKILDFLSGLTNIDIIVHDQYSATVGSRPEHNYSELYKGFQEYAIGPLSLEDTAIYLSERLSNKGLEFSPQFVKNLHNLSGGRPLEINTLLEKLKFDQEHGQNGDNAESYEEALDRLVQNVKVSKSFTLEDIKNDADDEIFNGFRFGNLMDIRRFYDRLFLKGDNRLLSKTEIESLASLSDNVDVDENKLINLIKLGLVTKENNKYSVNGEILKRFIKLKSLIYKIENKAE